MTNKSNVQFVRKVRTPKPKTTTHKEKEAKPNGLTKEQLQDIKKQLYFISTRYIDKNGIAYYPPTRTETWIDVTKSKVMERYDGHGVYRISQAEYKKMQKQKLKPKIVDGKKIYRQNVK